MFKHLILAGTLICAATPWCHSESTPPPPQTVVTNDVVLKRLGKVGHCKFNDLAFEDFAEWLRTNAGVNVIVDPELIISEPPPITLQINESSYVTILNWVQKITDVHWQLKDGAIYFHTEFTPNLPVERRVYDVKDLLQAFPDHFPPVNLPENLQQWGNKPGGLDIFGGHENNYYDIDMLIDSIFMIPGTEESWDFDGVSIEEINNDIVVYHTKEVHKKIETFFLQELHRIFQTITNQIDVYRIRSQDASLLAEQFKNADSIPSKDFQTFIQHKLPNNDVTLLQSLSTTGRGGQLVFAQLANTNQATHKPKVEISEKKWQYGG